LDRKFAGHAVAHISSWASPSRTVSSADLATGLVDRIDQPSKAVVEDAAELVDTLGRLAQRPHEVGEPTDVSREDHRFHPRDIGPRRFACQQLSSDHAGNEAQERVRRHSGVPAALGGRSRIGR
jgi:hypothetical protein